MKKFKIICSLLLCTAFIISCENESMDSVEDTKANLSLFKGVTTPEKEATLKELKENALTSRAPITYEGQLCPGEVASGETALGSVFEGYQGADFWYFEANAGDVISFEIDRTNCNSDPVMELYWGYGDTSNLIYLGFLDDEDEPACTPDCFAYGDPKVVDALFTTTGTYTIGVFDWGPPCGVGTATYDIVMTGQSACVINIDGCDSGVTNQLIGDSNMDEMLDALEAAEYKNHGQFVRSVAHLVNGWYDAGLITLAEKDAIMKCAAQANIPSK